MFYISRYVKNWKRKYNEYTFVSIRIFVVCMLLTNIKYENAGTVWNMQVKSLPSAIVWLQMYSCGIAEDKDGSYIITGGYNL